ncbi:MAG: FG-GAP repeat protein, partial [Myxococcota bacterium]
DALGSGGLHVVADLDGTGLVELLVGTPGGDTGTRDIGLVVVHCADGRGTLRGDARVTFTGNNTDDWFGSDLAPLGDLDGDGHVEIAVGSYQNDIYGTDDGTVYVVEPYGLDGAVVGAVHTTSILYGDGSAGWLGYAVAGGDFDGDGLSELAAGAPGEDGARGEVYVAGAVDGLGTETFDADGALFRLTGVSPSDHLGYALTFGDLDADGYADLVACSPDDDDAADAAGTCWIVAGEATRGSVSVPGVSVNAVDTAVVAGGAAGERVGPSSRALSVGDLDGDGRDDLAVGVPGADGDTVDGGAAWIFANGTLSGTLGGGDATWALTGDGELGTALALVDVTGDRLADLVAGAPEAGPADEGVVYLFAGGAAPGAYALPADQHASFTGEATLDAFGVAVTGGHDLDGDGRLD